MVLESLLEKIQRIESEESGLDEEENRVDQRIRKLKEKVENGAATEEDFANVVNYLQEESSESEELVESIYETESELLEIDSRIESGEYSSNLAENVKQVISTHNEEERIIEHFREELDSLRDEVEEVSALYSNSNIQNRTISREIKNCSNTVNNIINNLDEIEGKKHQIEGEKDKISQHTRRELIKKGGAALGGAAAASAIGSNNPNPSGQKISGGRADSEIEDLELEYNIYLTSLSKFQSRSGGKKFTEEIYSQVNNRLDTMPGEAQKIQSWEKADIDSVQDGTINFWKTHNTDKLLFSPHPSTLTNSENPDQPLYISISLGFQASGASQKNFIAASGLRYDTPGGGDWNLTAVSDGWAPENNIGIVMEPLTPGELRSGRFSIQADKRELLNTKNLFSVLGIFVEPNTGETRFIPMEIELKVS